MIMVGYICYYYGGGKFVAYHSNKISIISKLASPKVWSQFWKLITHYSVAYPCNNFIIFAGKYLGVVEKNMDFLRHNLNGIR